MFPSWALTRSLSSSANGSRANSIACCCILLMATLLWQTNTVGAEPAVDADGSKHATPASGSKLVLGVRWTNSACGEHLQQRTKTALAVLSLLGDFDCRLSSEALSYARPGDLVVDGPFQDTLLNIPVHGQAHVEGKLTIVPVADDRHAAIDVHVNGVARLEGSGTSHRVQIESDATVTFHAVKRLFFDTAGVTSLPATCTAESDMIFKEITARQQPKLLGKFAERVAHRKVADSHEAAEEECSEHVVEAICAAFDRELGDSAKVVNATLNDFLAAASKTYQTHWERVRFRTATDSVRISRESGQTTQFAALPSGADAALPLVLIRIPRDSIGVQHLLAGLHLLQPASEVTRPGASKVPAAPAMRSSVSWQEKTVTLSVDYDRTVGLAQEPVVGAGQ